MPRRRDLSSCRKRERSIGRLIGARDAVLDEFSAIGFAGTLICIALRQRSIRTFERRAARAQVSEAHHATSCASDPWRPPTPPIIPNTSSLIEKAVMLAHGFNNTGEIDAQNRRERMSCVGRSANTNLEIEWVCATHS
jgi:hypothetical protein